MNLPKARTTDIIEQEAGGELLIYDLQTNKAYTLNETLKNVYKACGKQTFEELKREHKFTDDLIHFSLVELSANNLVEDYDANHFAGLSRREVIKKVGLATMIALPVIAGITAPNAIQAASGCINANGSPTGAAVSATNVNPSNDTSANQTAVALKLNAQCCSGSYNNFISNGCSFGTGATCSAQAICN
jgi:hypothetical protein